MRKFIFLCVLLSVLFDAKSQDPFILNSNQSLIYLNPSFAGSNGLVRNQFSYRNQWPELLYPFVTYVNSFDAYVKPLRAGLAFSFSSDDQMNGTLKTNVYSLAYAQHLNLFDKKLKVIPSVQFGYGRKILDVNNLTFGDAVDPRYGYIWNSQQTAPQPLKTYFDLSAGLLLNYKKNLYIGTSFFHINQPDQGLLGNWRIPFRFVTHASYTFHFSEKTLLQLFYKVEVQQKFYSHQFAMNMLIKNHVIAGLGYSSPYTPCINLGYRSNWFSIQLGYDVMVSEFAGTTTDSWEIHTSFNLRNKELRRTLTNFETW
jgi:type IX secretion system PorP/SprF family membrane protein